MRYWLERAKAHPDSRQRRQARSVVAGLFNTTRARLRIALVVCLGVAGLLAFVAFPPRRVAVDADGSQTVVVSRVQDLNSLLKLAGVQREAGDVVVRDGDAVRVERAIPVVLQVDGRVLAWRTRATTVKSLLDELGVEVSPYDGLLFNGVEVGVNEPLFPGPLAAIPFSELGSFGKGTEEAQGISLVVHRAVPFTIVEDGHSMTFKSSRPTIAMALRDAGIRLGPADEVFPQPASILAAGQEINVKHAFAISLRTGDSVRTIYTQHAVLRDALAEAGLSLGTDDRVEPSVDANVTNGMTARLVRVAGRQFIEKENVSRKTVFKPDESLSGSSSRIVQGLDGVHLREYRIVIEDGVETERKLIRDYYDPEPADTVIYYAASALRATGLAAETLNVMKIERVYATWYNAASSGRPPTDPYYGITASGQPLTKGVVAVDPRVIPLGTRLYIPGYGLAVAADTGGGIVGNMIDLGYPDGVVSDWQTGWVDVFLLAP